MFKPRQVKFLTSKENNYRPTLTVEICINRFLSVSCPSQTLQSQDILKSGFLQNAPEFHHPQVSVFDHVFALSVFTVPQKQRKSNCNLARLCGTATEPLHKTDGMSLPSCWLSTLRLFCLTLKSQNANGKRKISFHISTPLQHFACFHGEAVYSCIIYARVRMRQYTNCMASKKKLFCATNRLKQQLLLNIVSV